MKLSQRLERYLKRVIGVGATYRKVLCAPTYDSITRRTASWAMGVKLPGVSSCASRQASHALVSRRLAGPRSVRPLLLFVGHGDNDRLYTHPDLGKAIKAGH